MSNLLTIEILQASGQTIYMVFLSTLGAILLGWPIGTLLYVCEQIKPNQKIAKLLNFIITY